MRAAMKEGDVEKVQALERFSKSYKSQYKGKTKNCVDH